VKKILSISVLKYLYLPAWILVGLITFSCTKTTYPCPAIETPSQAQMRKKDLVKQDKNPKKSKNKYDQNGRLIKKSYSHAGLRR